MYECYVCLSGTHTRIHFTCLPGSYLHTVRTWLLARIVINRCHVAHRKFEEQARYSFRLFRLPGNLMRMIMWPVHENVYVYLHRYVCMYVCMYVFMQINANNDMPCTWECVCVYSYICACVCMNARICLKNHLYVIIMHMHVYIRIYIYVYIYICIYIHIHTYKHTYIYG
jgi:hypothetical protein